MSLREEFEALRLSLPPPGSEPVSGAERTRNYKKRKRKARAQNIAILDMETDPFDNIVQDQILPYLAVLYSDEFDTIIIWDEDHDAFIARLLKAITDLPNEFTIYAHNGGKFDFMFLVHKLRGAVAFKGRGIMRASIGRHEIRDSYHIIPERLANLKKQEFDYSTLKKGQREKHKQAIIDYCVSDCVNLLYYVKKFIDKFSFKISVGAAAMAKLNEHYHVEKVAPSVDEFLRYYFAGGRVECIQGAGYYSGALKLYDVNSMYPHIMATLKHPVGSEYVRRGGKPNANTIFLKLDCENNGALLARDEKGELTSRIREGIFHTTKWEYETALELGLIWNVKILECVDCFKFSTFEKFVTPLYAERAAEKTHLATLLENSSDHQACEAEILFLKLLLNNAYGKFAQNPRRYKDHFITDPGEVPELADGENPYDHPAEFQGADYWIWSRPAPSLRFNNVGTAASITGGARAMLMRAIHHAKNPVYCDTDSLICEELRGFELHKTHLGAWDLEKEISELIIVGKKLYAYREKGWTAGDGKRERFKTKGFNPKESIINAGGRRDLEWNDMLSMLNDAVISVRQTGPTLTKTGKQSYITRRITRTTPLRVSLPDRGLVHDAQYSNQSRLR